MILNVLSRVPQFLLAGVLATLLTPAAQPAALPVWFEPSAGGGYLSRQGGTALHLLPDRLRWTFPNHTTVEATFGGTRLAPRLTAEQPLAAHAQYLTATRREIGIPLYQRARYQALYPGIDLVFHSRQAQPEFDFELAPGADPSSISLHLRGHRGLTLEADGSLSIDAPGGKIRWQSPVVLQAGARLEGHFRLLGRNSVGFTLGTYNSAQPLVIDPLLTYSTYFGGSGNEGAAAITTDSTGNVYVAGLTTSQNLPVSRTAVQPAYGGQASGIDGGDSFVAKFTPAGALSYVTYIGGSGDDVVSSIAVDLSGNVYLGGMTTSRNFPVTAGAPQKSFAGSGANQLLPSGDGFVLKLNATGSQIVYATYLGGPSDDSVEAIAVDTLGNLYAAGATSSTAFPTTEGAYQSLYKGNIGQPILPRFGMPFRRRGDVFVAKLNPGGTQWTYSTLLGGQREESARALVIDASGNAYVAGYTLSSDFPVTPGAYQTQSRGADLTNDFFNLGDAFITKVNPTGTALIYSTYLGGNGDDIVSSMALDSAGNAYLTGATSSTNFPVTAGVYSTRNNGPVNGNFESFDDDQLWGDSFVAKLSSDGARILLATYYGGSSDEIPSGIALDQLGNVIIGGMTNSSNLAVSSDAAQAQFGGRDRPFVGQAVGDGFVAQFNPTLTSLLYATYLGGSREDAVGALALDRSGNLWLTGNTASTNLPVKGSAAQSTFGGSTATQFFRGDSFLTRLDGFGVTATPTLSIKSINNAANYDSRLAPGMIFVAFTSSAGPKEIVGAALTPTGFYDTVRAETRFLFDGVPAPLIYVGESQSSGIVPYSVEGKSSVQVVAEYLGQRSAPLTLPVSTAAPGLFSVNQAGTGPGSIYNQDNTLNTPTTPAAKGSIVVLYGTGEGATSPRGVDGKVAATEYPKPTQTVTATVAGQNATILYAGAIPFQVAGLFQVNIQLPTGLPSGNHPVIVTVGGVASQANLTVAVQ